MVRAMRAMDAVNIGLLHQPDGRELTARTWPKAPPENYHPTLLRLLSGLAKSYTGDRKIGVAVEGDRPAGLVSSRSRASGLVWDVEHLIAPNASVAVDLLTWACDHALAAGGRRVFLETQSDDDVGEQAARRAGFERYSEGSTYVLDRGFSQEAPDSLPARPRLTSDEQGLFQLYNAAVPAPVRAAEAMTYDEWKALYPGRKAWAPSVLGNRQDFVWELGSRVIGWMRLVFGQRSQYLELLIHPLYESYADKMILNALTQMSPKVPVLVDVREYHAGLRAALEQAGFRAGASYTIWVRQLAVRVTEPATAAQVPA
jgi:hypothetical protein